MNPTLRNSAAHVFVSNLDAPALSDEDSHHLSRVLRLRSGETVTISDGAGAWRTATFSDHALIPMGDVQCDNPRGLARIAFVPLKGDRSELIVQKATEIGVSEIVVMAPTARSVVKWDDTKFANEVARFKKIARESSMQSRRTFLPVISGPLSIAEVARAGFVLAEPSGNNGEVCDSIAVGPEGGFSDEEVALFDRRVNLGSTILRAETAGIVAAVRVTDAVVMRG